eukprot:TRINITY_DN9091_c0_g1_i1.p1 TRINITY_DN9091_c0_g1~~TRINITY_DN9091_c0_g1_i1.p1  ORF type:complete len:530 (-),score=97.23 TRINITY_DN9091_c0_g1_i1:7-1527(-)
MKPLEDGTLAPRPGYLTKVLAKRPQFHDPMQPPLTTEVSQYGKRVHYKIKEYSPLVDSSTMSMESWEMIAGDVQKYYDDFDAFILLHGTDTMSYTASALSFMFTNLTKTVIITGSQIPISKPHSDASDNLYGSLMIAGHFRIPEVCIYFNHKLLRGNRTTKFNTEGYDAFSSLNYPPLVEVGVNVVVHWRNIRAKPPHRKKGFSVQTKLCKDVVVLTLFPGITPDLVKNILAPPVKGCVLQTFGAGNAPTTEEFLQPFKDAIARGVLIINITQCPMGVVYPYYAVGKALSDVGIIIGWDMTLEAALTKLSIWIAKDKPIERKRMKLGRPTRGEMVAGKTNLYSFEDSHVLSRLVSLIQKTSLSDNNHDDDPTKVSERQILESIVPTLFCIAGGSGNTKELNELIECGYKPSFSDYDGRTALHLACANGRLDTVKFLVESGSNVNIMDRWGRTPLDDAVFGENPRVVEYLIGKDAKRNAILVEKTDSTGTATLVSSGDNGRDVIHKS